MTQGEEHRKPAEHAHREGFWVDGYAFRSVEHTIKEAREAMDRGIYFNLEVQINTSIIACIITLWMAKFEAVLDRIARIKCVLHVHNIGGLQISKASASSTLSSIGP
eukprot:Skav226497  [mRNA]  locus=scaffold4305:43425:45463:- [translate_table: standard]